MPRYYRPYRTTSVIVYNNHRHQIDRYRSGNNGRNRNDGYRSNNNGDRYDGRTANNRNRYEGNGRTRTDYNNRSNQNSGRRDDANVNTSRNRLRSDEGSSKNNYQKLNTPRSGSTSGSNYKKQQFSTEVKRTQNRRTESTGIPQKQVTEIKRAKQFQVPKSKPSFNEGSRQQRPARSSSVGGSGSSNRIPKPSGGEIKKGSTGNRGRH